MLNQYISREQAQHKRQGALSNLLKFDNYSLKLPDLIVTRATTETGKPKYRVKLDEKMRNYVRGKIFKPD
ncbi:MAG: hypothetical protein QNJ54_27235 [Prochloraceae cyanobacterium]|nr:hypothetical protein [Prochloraceae cyanobacterium]